MFYLLSKTVGNLCYPLPLALLLLLLASRGLRRGDQDDKRRRRWRRQFWLGLGILWFCSAPWGANRLLYPLEKDYQNRVRPARADAILVLGGSLDLERSEPGHLEFNDAADRFLAGLELARDFPAAKLVFSGGTTSFTDHTKTEASLLKAEAIRLGVAPERILVDDRSRNTRENAQECKRLVGDASGQALVLVTSAFHLRRSLACFRQVGLEPTPYAADVRNHYGNEGPFGWFPQAGCLNDATAAVREYVGLVMYRLKGYA